MVRSQIRQGFEGWVLQAFLGIFLICVALLVADGLGFMSHGRHGVAERKGAGLSSSGVIRPAAMEEFRSGKFSTKKAWFYHGLGRQNPSMSAGRGRGESR